MAAAVLVAVVAVAVAAEVVVEGQGEITSAGGPASRPSRSRFRLNDEADGAVAVDGSAVGWTLDGPRREPPAVAAAMEAKVAVKVAAALSDGRKGRTSTESAKETLLPPEAAAPPPREVPPSFFADPDPPPPERMETSEREVEGDGGSEAGGEAMVV